MAIRWAGLVVIVYIPQIERPLRILTGMTNQHHGRGRGRVFAGFHVCSRGLVAGGMPWGFGDGVKQDKNMACARVREGHPTPPALAMQTRHIFYSFRVIGMGYFANP